MSNEVIELITSHRSTRKYTDQPISEEILKALFNAAQWAPSSHHVQAYSIIVVKNKETKQSYLSSALSQAGPRNTLRLAQCSSSFAQITID